MELEMYFRSKQCINITGVTEWGFKGVVLVCLINPWCPHALQESHCTVICDEADYCGCLWTIIWWLLTKSKPHKQINIQRYTCVNSKDAKPSTSCGTRDSCILLFVWPGDTTDLLDKLTIPVLVYVYTDQALHDVLKCPQQVVKHLLIGRDSEAWEIALIHIKTILHLPI